ncbi:hypothetical protein ABW19_dt0207370 [Dactylella cylindrospora]|nr:hypothetical protein ABW19_dt0207370 [Dactylella cylindrospora]
MVDSRSTTFPRLTKLSPTARFLRSLRLFLDPLSNKAWRALLTDIDSYDVNEEITAPAQFYPLPLPRTKTTNDSKPPLEKNRTETVINAKNDRSIIVYGTNTGLTILYPRKLQRCERSETPDADSEGDDSSGSKSWVKVGSIISENGLARSFRNDAPADTDKHEITYESYSEPEGSYVQRNARFPWTYSIDIGAKVVGFSFPAAFMDEQLGTLLPWSQNMYIAAVGDDRAIRLISLPLRLPPPCISSNKSATNDFQVQIVRLETGRLQTKSESTKEGWYLIVGTTAGLAPGTAFLWNTEIYPNGQLGEPSLLPVSLAGCNTSEILIGIRSVSPMALLSDAEDAINLFVAQRLRGVVHVLHLDPFRGLQVSKKTLWTPMVGSKGDEAAVQRPGYYLDLRKRILDMKLEFRRGESDWIYRLWTLLDDGEYGYWDLMTNAATLQHDGYCSKDSGVFQKDDTEHNGSIVVAPMPSDTSGTVRLVRHNSDLKIIGSNEKFHISLGVLLSHHSNQLSFSSFTNVEGTQRAVMTEYNKRFTILEFNLSGSSTKTYFQEYEDSKKLHDPFLEAVERRQRLVKRQEGRRQEIIILTAKLQRQRLSATPRKAKRDKKGKSKASVENDDLGKEDGMEVEHQEPGGQSFRPGPGSFGLFLLEEDEDEDGDIEMS